MSELTRKELVYLESVSFHDANQSEDDRLRRTARRANLKLQNMLGVYRPVRGFDRGNLKECKQQKGGGV